MDDYFSQILQRPFNHAPDYSCGYYWDFMKRPNTSNWPSFVQWTYLRELRKCLLNVQFTACLAESLSLCLTSWSREQAAVLYACCSAAESAFDWNRACSCTSARLAHASASCWKAPAESYSTGTSRSRPGLSDPDSPAWSACPCSRLRLLWAPRRWSGMRSSRQMWGSCTCESPGSRTNCCSM